MAALMDQDMCDTDYEIIIVDNGTPNMETFDEKWKKKCSDKGIKYSLIINHLQLNPYVSRNMGITASQGKYLALLDASCIPDKLWLKKALTYIKESDIVAGKYVMTYSDDQLKNRVHGLLYLNNDKNVALNYGVPGGNLLINKSVFDRIGLFGTDTVSGQDIAWSRNALSKGISIKYAHDMIVEYPSHSWAVLVDKVKKYANGVQSLQKSSSIDAPSLVQKVLSWLPMRPDNFRAALEYRDINNMSVSKKLYVYWLIWRIKIIYAMNR